MANESRRNLLNMQNTREVFPDFLRGFALLGIVLVNAPFLGLIAAAGRHSLSVYISQSLILAFVFSNWGLGLFGQLQLWLVTLIAIAAWLVPSLLALWNSRYRASGPLEWLLKKTTAPFRSQQ